MTTSIFSNAFTLSTTNLCSIYLSINRSIYLSTCHALPHPACSNILPYLYCVLMPFYMVTFFKKSVYLLLYFGLFVDFLFLI